MGLLYTGARNFVVFKLYVHMHELVYVLTVEALVFGMLCVVLVAQRLDVFDWPAGRTWPVFSSCVLLVLAYAQLLLALCCFIAVGRFGAQTQGMMDACARTAGRLVSAVFASVCYVGVLLWLHHREIPEELPCLLNQLWGTSCGAGSAVLWSYGVYLAVLLPAFALLAGLQVTAAGMCKDRQRRSCRRLVCVNCAYVLVHNVYYTWEINAEQGCHSACGVTPAAYSEAGSTADANVVLNQDLLRLLIALAVCDICAELALWAQKHNPLSVLVFCMIRIGELAVIPIFNRAAVRGNLPTELWVAHLSLSAVLCLLDITDAKPAESLRLLARPPWRRKAMDASAPDAHTPASAESQPTGKPTPGQACKAFEVEPVRRRKFMLTFNATSRWPTTLSVPGSKKGS